MADQLEREINSLRNDLSQARAKLYFAGQRFAGYGERFQNVQGLLTCAIAYLHMLQVTAEKERNDSASATA